MKDKGKRGVGSGGISRRRGFHKVSDPHRKKLRPTRDRYERVPREQRVTSLRDIQFVKLHGRLAFRGHPTGRLPQESHRKSVTPTTYQFSAFVHRPRCCQDTFSDRILLSRIVRCRGCLEPSNWESRRWNWCPVFVQFRKLWFGFLQRILTSHRSPFLRRVSLYNGLHLKEILQKITLFFFLRLKYHLRANVNRP